MKKLLIINLIFGFICLAVPFAVKADDKTTATVSHVISETIKGTDIDHGKLLEQEISKLGHDMALQMVSILQQHLPYIMDGVITELKLELDKTHKCLLLKDTKIGDKDCGKSNN